MTYDANFFDELSSNSYMPSGSFGMGSKSNGVHLLTARPPAFSRFYCFFSSSIFTTLGAYSTVVTPFEILATAIPTNKKSTIAYPAEDPVLLSSKLTLDFRHQQFGAVCGNLTFESHTSTSCAGSFAYLTPSPLQFITL
ncbi:unnamed protein product [Prunus brigantina]